MNDAADPTGDDASPVTVIGLDEPVPTTSPRSGPSFRVGWVAALLAVGLVVLLLLPMDEALPRQPLGEGEVPAPADERLLPWPGRGPWAGDEGFLADAASAWRQAARSDPVIAAPGDEIAPLWAGPVSGAQLAVLQSVGDDGVVHLAQVSDMVFGRMEPDLHVRATTRVDLEPEFVVFPFVGPDDRGGQLDPDVLATFQMLPGPGIRAGELRVLRLDGSRFVPVELQDDGLSEPWAYGRWWIRDEPVIAVLVRGEDDGLVSVVRLDPDDMVPAPPPVVLAEPRWGTDDPDEPADYLAVVAALESVGASAGRAAVLGSVVTAAGRATLVELEPPGSMQPSTMAALSVDGGFLTSSPAPVAPGADVALGAVRTPDGEIVVIAAASPEATEIRIEADGGVIAAGLEEQATVLPDDADVAVLVAEALRGNELLEPSASLDVADIDER